MRRGKKYLEAAKKFDPAQAYDLDEALGIVKKIAYAKFDETIEMSVKLLLTKSETVRDTVVLPNTFTAEKRILVFAKGEKAEEARQAGAAYVGDDDLVQKIKGGWLDFDVAVATPDMMKTVGRLGPILGRRGLMPNPKTHTVTMDVKGTLEELRKGRVEFRADKTGVVHLAIGKVSMDSALVAENAKAVYLEIIRRRPSDHKGEYVGSVAVSSTMGPGVAVSKDRLAEIKA